nr:hypothetical protein [uncultured Rhodopila sp.]
MDDETRSYLAGMMAQIDMHFESVLDKLSAATNPAATPDDEWSRLDRLQTERATLRARNDAIASEDDLLSALTRNVWRMGECVHRMEGRLRALEDRVRTLEEHPDA